MDQPLGADTVILDLDGVLVDVSGSYRRAVKESVSIVYGASVDDALIQSLKDVGGFNNDWKVTYASALFVLSRRERPDLSLDQWISEIDAKGKGLTAAVEAVESLLSTHEADSVLDRWNKKKLWKIFQELYLGTGEFERIENEASSLVRSGYINEEPILIDRDTIDWLESTVDTGILTGRPRTEAEIALDRLEWDLDSESLVAMEDWDHEKPAPDALIRLAESFLADELVYVGDTLDDIRTARNAAEEDTERSYKSLGVLTGGLTGEDGRSKYEATGADGILETINDLPDWIRETSPP